MAWESELWRKKCRWIIHITWEIDTLLVLTLCLLYWHSVCCVDTLVVLTLCLYCDALFDDLSFWMLAEKTEMHNADHLGNELWNTCKTYTSAQWASSSDALFVLTWVSEWWHSLMTWDSLWRLFWWLKKCRWIMHITLFDDLSFWMMAEKMKMNYAHHLGKKLWNTCKTYTSAKYTLFVLAPKKKLEKQKERKVFVSTN